MARLRRAAPSSQRQPRPPLLGPKALFLPSFLPSPSLPARPPRPGRWVSAPPPYSPGGGALPHIAHHALEGLGAVPEGAHAAVPIALVGGRFRLPLRPTKKGEGKAGERDGGRRRDERQNEASPPRWLYSPPPFPSFLPSLPSSGPGGSPAAADAASSSTDHEVPGPPPPPALWHREAPPLRAAFPAKRAFRCEAAPPFALPRLASPHLVGLFLSPMPAPDASPARHGPLCICQ